MVTRDPSRFTPDLAIVIVNWNVRDWLRACLASVYADLERSGLRGAVWVVDNASHDGSVEMVRADFPQVWLIASQQNLGFAGGNNLALRRMVTRHASRVTNHALPRFEDYARYVLLLNPDTEVQPGALRALVDFMGQTPRAGMAGAQLAYGDGSFQHGAFGLPGLWQIIIDLFPVPARLHESRLNGRYSRSRYRAGEPFSIGHPLGAAMLVRRQVIEQVGLFDERFHMYCEEIDWCLRIKQAGWSIYCVPRARIVHHAGQSTAQIKVESFINLWRSRRRLYDKHYSPSKRYVALALVRLGLTWNKWAVRRRVRRGKMNAEQGTAQLAAYEGAWRHFLSG